MDTKAEDAATFDQDKLYGSLGSQPSTDKCGASEEVSNIEINAFGGASGFDQECNDDIDDNR